MVEVYSTNVKDIKQADFLLQQLGIRFPTYESNFDLDDCDNILRVKSVVEKIEVFQVIDFLNSFGFIATVLKDSPECFKESIPLDILARNFGKN
ncbi:MAG: hypothetical protein ABIP95_06460 [Pelobium sp.]